MMRFGALTLVCIASASVLPATALAAISPVPQVISRGQVVPISRAPIGRTPHSVFGAIVRIEKDRVLLRTREGRILEIDPSEAIRLGTVSAPLFVGKLVVVGGEYDLRHVLHARTITRMTRIDGLTPPDN